MRLVENLVGDMTGGLAIATVAVATFWGAVSGSGPATVAALGLILIPAMVKNGYDKAFAAANVSVTSGLAIVIPPSIAFIVYGALRMLPFRHCSPPVLSRDCWLPVS